MIPLLTVRVFLATLVLTTLSGCLRFPRAEAQAKARDLRDRGYPSDAQRLEERARDLPASRLEIGPDEFDPRNDPYHYPELQVPEEKRRKVGVEGGEK